MNIWKQKFFPIFKSIFKISHFLSFFVCWIDTTRILNVPYSLQNKIVQSPFFIDFFNSITIKTKKPGPNINMLKLSSKYIWWKLLFEMASWNLAYNFLFSSSFYVIRAFSTKIYLIKLQYFNPPQILLNYIYLNK